MKHPAISGHQVPSAMTAPQPSAVNVETLYFLGPQNQDKSEFDFAPLSPQFLSNIDESGRPKAPFPRRTLLPEDFAWQSSASGSQRIPMLLSEFCAYKSALAYCTEKEIFDRLGEATDPCFFDTAGRVTDTQGFGCCYDGMVFISMRGTEGGKSADWRVNLSDNFTDQIDDKDEAKIAKLVKRFVADADWSPDKQTAYKAELQTLIAKLKGRPGMHLGFAMAWEEVSGKVVAYLEGIKAKYGSVPPIVVTGHSLGGALATVGAHDLRQRNYPIAAVVTFGAPCVGNNTFAAAYRDSTVGGYSLGDRTVRFLADGDAVPKVMRRWYYRWANSIKRSVSGGGKDANLEKFDDVGNCLMFSGAPTLSIRLIEMAIETEIERRAKVEREANKARMREGESVATTSDVKVNVPAKAHSSSTKGSNVALVLASMLIIAGLTFAPPTLSLGGSDVAQASKQSSTVKSTPLTMLAQAAQPAPPAKTLTPTPGVSGSTAETADINILYVLLFIAVVFLVVVIGSKFASHAVANRYALYLSTLSYQKIRSFRADEPDPLKSRLAAANSDLDRYLRFIRGDTRADSAMAKSLKVAELPVRLVEGLKLDIFKSANEKTNVF